jgi:hypothetical protein
MSDRNASNAIVAVTGFYAEALAAAEQRAALLEQTLRLAAKDQLRDKVIELATQLVEASCDGGIYQLLCEAVRELQRRDMG